MIFGRRFLLGFFFTAFAFASAVSVAAKTKTSPAADSRTAYKGAIVTDAATGKVLFEDNADLVSPPASMTKLMTFAIVHDKLVSGALSLTTPVRITDDDARMGGTQVYLDPRETFPVEELLYALMIQSANDAASALAHAAAGSSPAFVDLMNAKAHALGMTHTTFRSPHGLPPHTRRIADGDLTTPRDFALLCRYLLLNTDVLKYTSVRNRDFGAQRPKGPQHMVNHNKLLGHVVGVDGLKTGYTATAGYCLSATAERGGHRVIAVVMGSFGRNGERDLGRARDRQTIELLERGFTAIPAGSPPFKGAPVADPAKTAGDVSPISRAPLTTAQKNEDAAPDSSPSVKFTPLPLKKK